LRNAQRRRAEFGGLPPDQLFPDWLARRWRQSYGAEALIGFAKGLIGGAALDLSLKPNLTDNALVPEGEDILLGTRRLAARDRRVVDLVGYGAGAWWVQDVAASLPARLIGVKTGAHVLDLCAAPGGKTAQLAAAGYKVTAVDADKGRLETLKANLDRLRLTAEIVCEDARGFGEGRVFDAVLIDAPCSATGTFRRHPEVIWQRQEADLAARAKLQAEIVENALGRLPRGGILVYSTCSLEAEEGEAVAAAFADGGRGLKAMPVAADEIGGFSAAVTGQGFVRTHPAMALPSGARGMDGFFAARLVRA
jgi:16S rRNA (cytosine967-C5)-methyltransferase